MGYSQFEKKVLKASKEILCKTDSWLLIRKHNPEDIRMISLKTVNQELVIWINFS